ncbi:MAG: hypothetical protein JWP07_1989 [Pseudonocardiales bacterium]|jgi:hypothetical protein|nr:hypothetical protein [Pseudonocardiales bacterium]
MHVCGLLVLDLSSMPGDYVSGMFASLAELVAVARVAGTPDLVNTRTRSTTG